MRIALLGDIALIGNFSIRNNPQIIEKLTPLRNYLSNFDLVIGNLETPFSMRKIPWGAKSSYLCSDIDNITILKALGIKAVSLANNHIYDFGKEGFDTTISLLQDSNIEWFGVDGKNYKIEYKNNKIDFEGFCCYSTNPLNISSLLGKSGINRFNINEVKKIIERNTKKGWLSILSIHSGIEHVNRPSIDQIKASRIFADISPYVWYGHHPHVIQGIEKYKGSLIAHSLGNFCFAGNKEDKNRPSVELSENNRLGLILELEIEANKIINNNYKIIHIEESGAINLYNNKELVQKYSSFIEEAIIRSHEYNQKRISQRKEYLTKRKELRNIKWILQRLRPRYFKLFIDNRRNYKKYKQNVTKYLD